MLLELILRWMHIFSAIALVGGTFMLRFSIAPALMSQSDETRQALLDVWRPRWARVVMITSLLLLVSGLVNAVRMIQAYTFPDAPYHALVAVKLLLAFVVFWIAAMLSGRSQRAVKAREQMIRWLTINVVLGSILVALAGYMKVTPHVAKSAETTATAAANSPSNAADQ